MKSLKLNNLKVQSFVTGVDDKNIAGGATGCPYVCITEPTFTQDPNGCLSAGQFICDDPYGVTGAHACG